MTSDLFGNRSLADTGERSQFDFYPTPAWAVRSLLYYVPEIEGTTVIEPASGDDAIVSVLREEFRCRVLTNDIDPRHPAQMHLDATKPELWQLLDNPGQKADWVITNPPFNVAFDILWQSVCHAKVGVAFLLRKTFLEPTQERGDFLANHPPSRIICLPRHNFRGDGSDSVSCDWMVWERNPARSIYPIEVDSLAKERGKGSV